ncbi:MAG: peptidoglycan-binding protein, partial [Deltaproteobacteria bacterium]
EKKAKDDAQAAADEAAMTAEIVAEKASMEEIGQAAADEADAIAEIVAEKKAMEEIGQAAADEDDAIAEMTAEKKAKDDAQAAADEAAKIAAIAADLGVKADDLAALVDGAKKADAPASHTVVAGDTLGHIAAAHGVSLSDVLAKNPEITNPDRIEVGQQIDLPAGAQKTDVAAAQSALAAAGYAVGPIDGIAGPKTEAAVRSFQRANGLKATGLIDGPTAKALSAPAQTPTPASIAGPTAIAAASTPGPLGALLDRIALGEGTGQAKAAKHGFKSGYDVTLGYGAYTPSSLKGKNLTDMTLGEVKQLQAGILNNPKNPHNSSAVGRYQIVGETLRGLQRQMGIPDSARFTPALQDQMATRLVEGRGLKSFQSGRLSARGFQANLAREWASIASPRTGTSHYGQATGTSTAQIQALLSGLR